MSSEPAGTAPAAAVPAAVPAEEIREALDAVCNSAHLARMDRLQRFLRFVCEATLRGESSQIKESVLALEVFGRPEGYSSHEDSTVRRQAHTLRQKLRDYYQAEGAGDPVRIELPVGRYVPVFVRQPARAVRPAEAGPPARSRRWAAAVVVVFGAAALFWAGWMIGRRGPGQAALEPAVAEIWAPWLRSPAGPLICFSNRHTALVKHYEDPPPVGLAPPHDEASPPEDRRFRRFFDLPGTGKVYLTPSLAQTKVGEAISAVLIGNLLGRAGVALRTTESRFMNWELLRKENIVLLGEADMSPFAGPLLAQQPIRPLGPAADHPRRIVVEKPGAGERASFETQHTSVQGGTISYVLVSFMPGLAPGRHVLLINGLGSRATQLGAEYLSSAQGCAELLAALRRMRPRPARGGAWHFQFVLETELREKVPTQGKLKAIRAL